MKIFRAKIFIMLSLCSTTVFATPTYCPQALPTSDPSFCASFEVSAKCFCRESTFSWLCHSMNGIYSRMVAYYGSLERACHTQTKTDPETCIDDWNCYRNGGQDSQGRPCSNNAYPCI